MFGYRLDLLGVIMQLFDGNLLKEKVCSTRMFLLSRDLAAWKSLECKSRDEDILV